MERHDPQQRERHGERFSQFATAYGIADGHDLCSANDTPALNALKALRGAPISMGRGETPVGCCQQPSGLPLLFSNEVKITMNKRAALYCRVDRGVSDENAHFAIEHQIVYLTRFAEKHHYTVIDIYSDIGFPGHDLTRPELNRMKQAAGKGTFDAILVVKRDRLFRGRWAEAPTFSVPIIVADEVRMKRKEEHLH